MNPLHPASPPSIQPPARPNCRVLIVMGVSGSGKSTVGRQLAQYFGGRYHEGDAYHPAENISKMSAGIPLDDSDRQPWLERLRAEVVAATPLGEFCVLACSALKRAYRDILRGNDQDVTVLYLKGSFTEIFERISSRLGHYMKSSLLESQFAALEEPINFEGKVIEVSISGEIDQIVTESASLLLVRAPSKMDRIQ